MIKNFFKKYIGGYTVIETMIAVSIFSVIAVAGTSTLLQANIAHQKSQDMRSIIDNLSFIMEEVSRNVRTGYNYHCFTAVLPQGVPPGVNTPFSCSSGGAIAFEYASGNTGNNNDQWLYKIEGSGGVFDISKSVDGGTTWIQLNPDEVDLSSASGFSVLGAESPGSGNTQQPLVTIRLVGSITYKNVVSPFSLETAVSQRLIDSL